MIYLFILNSYLLHRGKAVADRKVTVQLFGWQRPHTVQSYPNAGPRPGCKSRNLSAAIEETPLHRNSCSSSKAVRHCLSCRNLWRRWNSWAPPCRGSTYRRPESSPGHICHWGPSGCCGWKGQSGFVAVQQCRGSRASYRRRLSFRCIPTNCWVPRSKFVAFPNCNRIGQPNAKRRSKQCR